jgi:glycogen operon protein
MASQFLVTPSARLQQPQTGKIYQVEPGQAHPLGATPDANGVNFSVFAQEATAVELLLFAEHDDVHPAQIIALDPAVNKTFRFWHVYVRGLRPGAHYAYRVDGPKDLSGQGHRYNPSKVLIDPYARGNNNALWNRADACGPADNLATTMRSVVIDADNYDWEGDRPLKRPMNESVIYELHVGGFTRHPSAGVKHPGTFAGIIEKIPYLKELGVTAVELLPVMEFDDTEVLRDNPNGGPPLKNYWGYSTVSFFAPHRGYCVAPQEGAHLREFRDMVKALHKAGIEVILDVVFNHTSEGNHLGPTINFKGFGNEVYYHLVNNDRQYYMDYSGCGNTFNCNHPIAEKLIVDSLRFWVEEMHVDGFRFDEGSILARGQDGAPLAYPPVVWNIELSDSLMDTKIIAEAWDAAGLYQIGYYPGNRWAEWNGRYRDDVRRFVKGDPGLVGAVAARIAGSADIYQANGHLPINSVNFITCHDGFTLNDLVSYDAKHNEANGEGNNDGANDNHSWNCGQEGETKDPAIEALRERQMKNFAAILLLSQGVPMLTAGDEVRRTQKGNNNAYCQDNEISWFDWSLVRKNRALFRFWKLMIDFRKRHPALHRPRFFTGQTNERGLADISWHGCELGKPGWNDPEARALAFTLAGFGDEPDLHVMLNMYWDALGFEVPQVKGRSWYLAVDTAEAAPLDIALPGHEKLLPVDGIFVQGRSVVVLISKPTVAAPGASR